MKKLFLFLVLFFSFVSLSAGWGEDLCEDVTCSGHGECHEDGENEWCVCDEGYIASGLDCILGCDGVTCSGHGVCSVVSGAEVCTCEAGFHASGLNCILNEASTVDTLAILNETDCYNTGNCHYRLDFHKRMSILFLNEVSDEKNDSSFNCSFFRNHLRNFVDIPHFLLF